MEQPIRVTVFEYDEQGATERTVTGPEECLPPIAGRVSWINVDGAGDAAMVDRFGRLMGFHPLLIEDIVHTDQRPKMEDFGEHVYVQLKMLDYEGADRHTEIDQLSLVWGSNYVISFQERPGDSFDRVRDRIRKGGGRLRRLGPDYLAYALVDAVVDHYFVVLERLGERIESLEDTVLEDARPLTLSAIHELKREMIALRKAVWPLREVLAGLMRSGSSLICESTEIYLRDVYDHVVQIADQIDSYRDMLSGILDVYHSTIGNRTNGIMKVLTLFSSIFMPLTFITGVFGMNFKYFPELEWRFGFVGVMVLMVLITAGMFLFFRHKRWL